MQNMKKQLLLTTLSLVFILFMGKNLWAQQITLLSPNGGDVFAGGSKPDIKWQSTGVDTLRISYTLDNGATWVLIGSNILAASGSYNWWLPVNQPSTNCRIRIEDKHNASTKDSSDNLFTIESYIKVKTPNGGDTLYSGRQYIISWSSVGTGSLTILYTIDDGLSSSGIVSNINAADSSYRWNIPLAVSNRVKVFIRAGFVNREFVVDTSDNVFSIVSIVNVKEFGSSGNIPKVFPNPTNGIINVEFESMELDTELTFIITDILGRELYTTNTSNFGNTIKLDFKDQITKSGVYFLQIADGNASYQKKLYISK